MNEVLHTPGDKRAPGTGLPRHNSTRQRVDADQPKRSNLWDWREGVELGGTWGVFPRRFLAWARKQLGSPRHERFLHVCSGALGPATPGVRVDVRLQAAPDVVADGRSLPFADDAFDAVLIDPPYSVEYARDLYGTDYPRPSHLLAEASRVCAPNGLIGFLHFLVAAPPPRSSKVRVFGITQGCGYRIRALSIYRREPRSLFARPSA